MWQLIILLVIMLTNLNPACVIYHELCYKNIKEIVKIHGCLLVKTNAYEPVSDHSANQI
jgi:hypothetical protein